MLKNKVMIYMGISFFVTVCILIGLYFLSPKTSYLRYSLYFAITGEEPKIPKDFTGAWKTWWGNGLEKEIFDVENGKVEGRFAAWYDHGTKLCEGTFKNGKIYGEWIIWHPNENRKMVFDGGDGLEYGNMFRYDWDGKELSKAIKKNDCGATWMGIIQDLETR
ncbi:MAG: hypothetical protein V1918_06605 [Planctomycetota bacterium]